MPCDVVCQLLCLSPYHLIKNQWLMFLPQSSTSRLTIDKSGLWYFDQYPLGWWVYGPSDVMLFSNSYFDPRASISCSGLISILFWKKTMKLVWNVIITLYQVKLIFFQGWAKIRNCINMKRNKENGRKMDF